MVSSKSDKNVTPEVSLKVSPAEGLSLEELADANGGCFGAAVCFGLRIVVGCLDAGQRKWLDSQGTHK